jgi:hypothetical protein
MEYYSQRFLHLHTFARNNYNNQPYTLGVVVRNNMHKFSTVQQPLVGQDILNIETSQSHSVRLLWTIDQPDTETSIWQQTTLKRDRRTKLRLDTIPQSQQASGRRPTP